MEIVIKKIRKADWVEEADKRSKKKIRYYVNESGLGKSSRR
jgi:hypothetical protein